MKQIGIDCDKYIMLQEKEILERVKRFDQKLYIEIGGKLFDDLHASRVLPGFRPDAKIRMLKKMSDKIEIIFCISSKHIEERKIRRDYEITYADEGLRQINKLREMGFIVSAVVITLFDDQPDVVKFANELKQKGENVYFTRFTKGYPNEIDVIVSEEGYGKNPHIKTTKPVVVVVGPGPCSGKLATCLSQLYHDYKNGIRSGYAKYETFPIHNLPLNHPVNVAYEAATADLRDENLIDNFHMKAYGVEAVNYNRDLKCFPVLKKILDRITGQEIYKSPTDMGVNKIGFAVVDDQVLRDAGRLEILRRYKIAINDYKQGYTNFDTVMRINEIIAKLDIE